MNWILAIPIELRMAALFVIGLLAGGLVNLAVYRLGLDVRSISPWSAPPSGAPPRRGADRLPLVGWLGLRREADLHGAGFWIRPMLVELLAGAGLAGLYWWEVGRMALLPIPVPQAAAPLVMPLLHAQFACHAVLIGLMLSASLIDVDDRIIPDTITLPGTLFGLIAVAVYPWSLLPVMVRMMPGRVDVDFLTLVSPNPWPPQLGGCPLGWPLVLALGCWWLWCVALMPRTWYTRHGWWRAIGLCMARLCRERWTWLLAALGLVGSIVIVGVWWVGGLHWQAVLSALVGMAAGGCLIWSVRVIGTAALGREAMGFGDVTLMAMIGALLGWQGCLIVFFLAPFAGIVIGIGSVLSGRGAEIPFGPFLCLAALVVIVYWEWLWTAVAPAFRPGWLVPIAMAVCLVLLGVLLLGWRLVVALFR